MNLDKFNLLMGGFKRKELGQDPYEWKNFLGFCSYYFGSRGISRPLVVEIGIWNGLQRRFYEQLLGAEYIGIDNGVPFAPITALIRQLMRLPGFVALFGTLPLRSGRWFDSQCMDVRLPIEATFKQRPTPSS